MNRRRLFSVLEAGDTVPSAKLTECGLGAVASAVSSYVTVKEVAGPVKKTIFTLASLPITMTDEAGVCAYGGAKLYDFPAGAIAILGCTANLTVTKSGAGINTNFDGDFGIGTATASNNATLTSTEQNIISSTATAQAVAGATTAVGTMVTTITALTDSTSGTADGTLEACADLSTSDTYSDAAVNAKIAILRNWAADCAAKINALIASITGTKVLVIDGTTTAPDLYLNFLIDDADQDGGGSLVVSGTITVLWANSGDK